MSKSKGFWDEGPTRSKGEMVMLMVSELGECLEAHRKGHRANPIGFLHDLKNAGIDINRLNVDDDYQYHEFTRAFTTTIKNSLEDEMADVVIRILDYVHGWGIPVGVYNFEEKESKGNFGHDLLRINYHMIRAFHGEGHWDLVLHYIYYFCKWYNIDLEQHIIWKMKYNSTRPQKHGKAY